MSAQGTGSIGGALEFEREILRSWGVWARSGDLGMGYGAIHWLKKSGVGVSFSDAELEAVDAVVAKLPPRWKRLIKRVYLHGDSRGITDEQVRNALSIFAEHFAGDAQGEDSVC